MALIDDLRRDLAQAQNDLIFQQTRASQWAAEYNRLMNLKNQLVFNRDRYDASLQQAMDAKNDALQHILRLQGIIATLNAQIDNLVNGTSAGLATGLSEEDAADLAEAEFIHRLEQEREAKKKEAEAAAAKNKSSFYLIGGIIVLIIGTITVIIIRRIRRANK